MNEAYLIVCNRHTGRVKNALCFWGSNFREYTSSLERAGKYKKDDAISKYGWFPVFGVDKRITAKNWQQFDDFLIREDQLKELGYTKITIYHP